MATCVVCIHKWQSSGNGPRQNIYSNVTHLFLGKELHEKSIGHEQEKIKGTLYNLESAQNSSQSHNTLTGLDTIWIMIVALTWLSVLIIIYLKWHEYINFFSKFFSQLVLKRQAIHFLRMEFQAIILTSFSFNHFSLQNLAATDTFKKKSP